MKNIVGFAVALATFAPLQAQTPNWGIALNIGIPTKDFREKVYPPTMDVNVPQIEGYDTGWGGQLTMSFPLNKNLAFRAGLGGMTTEGTNTAYGYDKLYCRHSIFSITGELQLFFEDAFLHRGTYLIAGISGNSERFQISSDNYWDRYSDTDESRKSRLGGIAGIGHSFYSLGGIRFVTEFSYHHSFSRDTAPYALPPADFFKVSIGFVF